MPFCLLWIFFYCMTISVSLEDDSFRSKRDSDYESESDLDELKYIEDEEKVSSGLKQERSLDHMFAPIGESDGEFEEDYFYDEDIKREKSLFPSGGFSPLMANVPTLQNNPGMNGFPNQVPQSNGVRTFPAQPISSGLPQNMPFSGSIPTNRNMPFPGSMHHPVSMPFQGPMSPQRTSPPQNPILPPANIPRPNSFPQSMSPFTSGSPNPFASNPNSRFPSTFQGPSANNFPPNIPQASPQRSGFQPPPVASQSFPQILQQPKPPVPSPFQQPIPAQPPGLPQQPVFPQQSFGKPAIPFSQPQAPLPFPQGFAPSPVQHPVQQPVPSPPSPPPAAAKPSFPLLASGMNPFQSLFPYFFLPFPFGK